jgi:hypothetical protein
MIIPAEFHVLDILRVLLVSGPTQTGVTQN